MKKVVYVDLDNVLVDFPSAFAKIDKAVFDSTEHKDDIPGIFALMEPVEGSIEAFQNLSKIYDVYILSTSPWANPSAWSDKVEWVKKYLGDSAYKRLILTHHKNLNKGDFLIDDRTKNGAGEFDGELILFGSEKFPDWKSVLTYLLPKKRYKVTAQSLTGDSKGQEYYVSAFSENDAINEALVQLVNQEGDGALIDNPAQMFTAEEIG